MKCPYCGYEETKVIDSRELENGFTIRRRRQCLKCEKRFTTYERIESTITVIKRDGRKENFDREKLLRGILKATDKTTIGSVEVRKIVDEIEINLRAKGKEVTTKEIGRLVMNKLKKLDKIAYIRFASVYKKFNDIKELEEEIKKIKKKSVRRKPKNNK